MAKGEPLDCESSSRGFESLQSTSSSLALGCDWNRSVAVYHVNRVRFPAGALAAPVLPPWRRWFARLSEKQEDPVRFWGTALHAVPVVCRPCSGSSLDSKSERAGFNSLTACHALVAQLEEHRFRKPGVVGSNPTEGTQAVPRRFCCRGREVRHLSATQDDASSSLAGSSFSWGRSSAGERSVRIREVPGSIPGGSIQ